MGTRSTQPPDRRPLERRDPEIVDARFRGGGFFDPRDVAQVKYEMLRAHRVDGLAVSEVAALFGVSRQTVYNVAREFEAHGLSGLTAAKPKGKPGPRDGWKCTREVVAYAARRKRRRPDLAMADLARDIEARFGVTVTAAALRAALAARGDRLPSA